ncbi:hypothetical protein BDW66DRAFT_155957 [Aspergillus desertorum]
MRGPDGRPMDGPWAEVFGPWAGQGFSYIDDEKKYRADFEKADEGRAQAKTAEAIDIFCGYQAKAEAVVRKAREQ